MPLRRYLDHIEIRSVNNAPSYVISFNGEIDTVQLAQAYRMLCERHPVLRARIVFDGCGYLLHVPDQPIQDLSVHAGGEPTLLQAIREPWDCQHGVAQLILVREGQHGYLAFRIDHAVADAGIKMALLRELLALYAELSHGASPRVERGESLPTSPYALLQQRIRGRSSAPPTGPARVPRPSFTLLEKRIQLRSDETSRLLGAARGLGTTVHALICGAILVAHRNHCAHPAPAPMTCWCPVNVRARVTPQVEATETTNLALIQETTVTIP